METGVAIHYTKISTFLSIFDLPSLEALELHAPPAGSEDYDPPYVLGELEGWGSSSCFKKLNLDGILFRNEACYTFLKAVPTLTQLRLAASNNPYLYYAPLARGLSYEPSCTDNILPNLERLAVHENLTFSLSEIARERALD